MDSPYQAELLLVFDAIQQAAVLSQAVLAVEDKGVLEKDDLSPVTVADFAIQALLTASIVAGFPSDRFVGEESADELRTTPVLLDRVWSLLQRVKQGDKCIIPASKDDTCTVIDRAGQGIPGSGRTWVFDPIDGTKTFVRGEQYAINVALMKDGKQVLGVVACPLLAVDAQAPVSNNTIDPDGKGCILFAVRGHGTWVRVLHGNVDEVPVRMIKRHAEVASVSELRSVTCATMLDSGIDDVHRALSTRLSIPFPGCDLLGWVPRWAALALGLGNVTVWVYKSRTRYAKIWDHAGATLLFEEVGGKITDVDGKDIDWTAGRKLTANYGFVAAPASIHAEVLKVLHETMTERGQEVLAISP
jgi:3'(2'), 5'-bisphosphate nucleotidase